MWGETVDTSDLAQTVWPRLAAIGTLAKIETMKFQYNCVSSILVLLVLDIVIIVNCDIYF